MRHRKKAVLGAAVAYALLLSMMNACAGNVDVAVTHVATYGARVSEILVESRRLVEKGEAGGLVPTAAAAQAMVGFKQAGDVTQKLADALDAYDRLAPNTAPQIRSQRVTEILTVLNDLRRYTRTVLVFVGDNAVGKQLLTLFDNLEGVFLEIQSGLLRMQAAR